MGSAGTNSAIDGSHDAAAGSTSPARPAARLLLSIAVAVVAGVIAAWVTPRGPVTTMDTVGWTAGAVLVGLACGFILGSRWAVLLAPIAFGVGFEIARLGTDGPTVDAVHLGSTYGIIAFVVGRGLSYLLLVPAMMLGGAVGVEFAARAGRPRAHTLGVAGWLGVALLTLVVVGVQAAFLRPAHVTPILGSDGEPLPGAVAELTSVELGGHEQTIMIRGRSDQNPVLLHLAGGPGGTDIGAMRADTSLEDDFVVVTWDQRGTGKSYGAIDPVETFTLQQMVSDTIELSEYLRDRFDEERIYMHGQSWGSLLGVLAVQQRPDLYHAWIGSGQMVSPVETDTMFWEDTVAWAESVDDDALAASLRESGPPPYEDMLAYEAALSHEHDWNPYPEFDGDKEMPFNLFVPENSLMDQFNGLRAFLDTFSVLYPQLQDIDFRRDAAELEVPVYLILGAHEARGRAVLTEDWFEGLKAPAKELITFPHSGHRPTFEEPSRFAELMGRVRDETYSEA